MHLTGEVLSGQRTMHGVTKLLKPQILQWDLLLLWAGNRLLILYDKITECTPLQWEQYPLHRSKNKLVLLI